MLRGRGICAISERPTPSPRPPSAETDLRVPVPLSSSSSVDCRLSAVGCFSLYFPYTLPPNSLLFCSFPNSYRKNGGDRGGPFDFQLSTLDHLFPVTPIIPVHPQNSPVSPIIPVHTQKQGGGGHFSAHRQMPAVITHALHNGMLHATQMQNVGAPTLPYLATPIPCSRRFLNLKLTTDHLKLPPPCSQGQRDQMGEYRPSECSTPPTNQGVLGYEAKGVPPGSE